METNTKNERINTCKKGIFAVLGLALMIVISVCAVCSILQKLNNSISSGESSKNSQISFVSQYPFSEVSANSSESVPSSRMSKLTDRFTTLKNAITTYSGEKNPIAPPFFNLYGVTNRLLGRDLLESSSRSTYRLPDGKIVFLAKNYVLEDLFDCMEDFISWLDNKDIPFLSVIPLALSDDTVYEYPEVFKTGYSDVLAYKLALFKKNNTSYLDTVPLLLSEDPNPSYWLYKTDHHWNVQAGIRTAKAIVERMSDEFHFPVDPSVCDSDNYRSVIYEDAFFGTIGKKVTLGYMKPEDLEVLIPEFETEFHIEVPNLGIDETGSFEETLLNPDALDRDYYDDSTGYDFFLYGDKPLIRIENKKCDNGIRVLMIKESKAEVVNPYLACTVQYLDIIDPRHFDGSIRTFIEKTEPDFVIMCSAGPQNDEDTGFELK